MVRLLQGIVLLGQTLLRNPVFALEVGVYQVEWAEKMDVLIPKRP